MSFIVISEASQKAWAELQLQGNFPFRLTVLNGAGDQAVVSLPSIALDDLDNSEISYRLIPESAIEQELSTRGLSYFRNMRAEDPTWPETPAELLPMGHIKIDFHMIEYFERPMREILETHGATGIEVEPSGQLVIRISETSPDDTEVLPAASKSYVTAVIQAKNFPQLFADLSSAGIAGYSRETMIHHSRDPDELKS